MLEPPYTGQKLRAGAAAALVAEVNRNHLVAGRNVSLRRTPAGTVVSFSGAAARAASGEGGIHPFRVRLHAPPPAEEGGSEPDPQWEVYLPPGSLVIGSSCYVMNSPASDTSGHAEETNWYKIPFGDPGTAVGTTNYRIVAHGKPSVRMNVGSSSAGGADDYTMTAPFLAVTAERITAENVSDHAPLSDPDLCVHYAGDSWSAIIATVLITVRQVDGETVTARSIQQTLRAAVVLGVETPTFFNPVWKLDWDANSDRSPIVVDAVRLTNREIYIGSVKTEAEDVDIAADGANVIALEIDTSGAEPEATLVVVGSEDTYPADTPTLQHVDIFTMQDNRVNSDLRGNLRNLYYYRGRG